MESNTKNWDQIKKSVDPKIEYLDLNKETESDRMVTLCFFRSRIRLRQESK